MEKGLKEQLLPLSYLSRSNLSPAEHRICEAVLKVTLIDGRDGLEYSLHSIGLLTKLEKRRVDVALASLLRKRVLTLSTAKNTVNFGAITYKVSSTNSINMSNVEHVEQASTVDVIPPKPLHDNPVSQMIQGINRYMPGVRYDGKTSLIESANCKRLYQKFYQAFPWSGTQEQAVGLLKDYLVYTLETDEWFKANARLPFTMLYKNVDRYIAGMKPKTRDDLAFEKDIGRRLSWYAKDRYWGASKVTGKD